MFFSQDIWRITEVELSKTRKLSYRLVKVIIIAVRAFIKDRLSVKASALTYSILFSVVPMIALIVAIGRGFGMEEMIENWLKDSFVAQSNMIPVMMKFVKRYLDSTQGGLFIGVGIAVLFYSVINFFIQVELAFNAIWNVKKPRAIVNQLTMYFSAMLLIPVFIVLSSGISIYINTILSETVVYALFSPVLKFIVYFSPYFINWIVFSIMYMVIPNTRVKPGNALIAGIIAGSAFQIFQILYINGQVYLSRYNVVYGSFAAIPLLLLWLQISCLIVLLGAEISYAMQNMRNFEYGTDTKNISTRYKNFISLFISYVVVKQFEAQKQPLSSDEISDNHKLPISLTNEILNELVNSGILIEVYNQTGKIKTYQPAIDINQMSIDLFFSKTESFGSELFLAEKDELLDKFWQKAQNLRTGSEFLSGSVLVKDIL